MLITFQKSPSRTGFDPDQIRIASWNICKGAGGRIFEHDYRYLCFTSDIVLVQEALLSKRSIKTFAEPGFEVHHSASYERMDKLRDGLLIASRVPAQNLKRVISRKNEPIFNTPKSSLFAEFPIEGSSLNLTICNHHSNLVRNSERAVQDTLHLLEKVANVDGPVIFGGDFNTFLPIYRRKLISIFEEFGFKLVEIKDDFRKNHQLLDHFFYRGLNLRRSFTQESAQSSDHFPIGAEFYL